MVLEREKKKFAHGSNNSKLSLCVILLILKRACFLSFTMSGVFLSSWLLKQVNRGGCLSRGAKVWHAQGEDVVDLEFK